jgi:hypothetical protein
MCPHDIFLSFLINLSFAAKEREASPETGPLKTRSLLLIQSYSISFISHTIYYPIRIYLAQFAP